jgi:hypothetical protein
VRRRSQCRCRAKLKEAAPVKNGHTPAARTSCRGSSVVRRRAARRWRQHTPAGRGPHCSYCRTCTCSWAQEASTQPASMPRMTWPSVISAPGRRDARRAGRNADEAAADFQHAGNAPRLAAEQEQRGGEDETDEGCSGLAQAYDQRFLTTLATRQPDRAGTGGPTRGPARR